MKTVVHFPIDVDSEMGDSLVEEYKVGKTYPVFVLADREANVIYRWTGYTGSSNFMSSLTRARSEMITVKERKARFKTGPTIDDALFLAQYANDTQDYPDAIEYYRAAGNITGAKRDFSYEIFKSTANSVWNSLADFDDIFPAADSVIGSSDRNITNTIGVGIIMARVARRKNRTDSIAKYLEAAIAAAKSSRNPRDAENLVILEADHALYARHDTTDALKIRKKALGEGWQNKPDKFYEYAKWCGERKIDLDQAEYFARKAVQRAKGDEFRAKVLSTLAEICYGKGNVDEAVSLINEAIKLDPVNDNYNELLLLYSK